MSLPVVRLKIKGAEDAGKKAFYDHLKNCPGYYEDLESVGLELICSNISVSTGRRGIEILIVVFNPANQSSLDQAMAMLDGSPALLVGSERELQNIEGKRVTPTLEQLPQSVSCFSFLKFNPNLQSNFEAQLTVICAKICRDFTSVKNQRERNLERKVTAHHLAAIGDFLISTVEAKDSSAVAAEPRSQHKLSKGIVVVTIVNVVGLTIPAIFIAAFLTPNKTSVLGFKVTAELLSISIAVISMILIGDIVCALVRHGIYCNPKANTDATHMVLPTHLSTSENNDVRVVTQSS